MKHQSVRVWALRSGVLSMFAIVLAHLALTDIRHGEADLTLEWNVLRASFVLIIAFHVIAMRALMPRTEDYLGAHGIHGAPEK